jgi:hypothetical protein
MAHFPRHDAMSNDCIFAEEARMARLNSCDYRFNLCVLVDIEENVPASRYQFAGDVFA